MQDAKQVFLLFTEQLRPQKLEEAILLPRVRKELERGLHNHILFIGPAGCGKTTCSRILAKGHDTLTINASLERGIDTIRDRVVTFATNSSLVDGVEQLKVIVLEECDNMTSDAWSSLRATIEKYSKTVRFIGNCNYPEKIPDPILSRFDVVSFNPVDKSEEEYLFNEYVKRASAILSSCKIKADEESVKAFVKSEFPDLRTVIKKIQQLVMQGTTELTIESLKKTFDNSALFALMTSKPDPWTNYKAICGEYANKAEEGVVAIGKDFPEYLRSFAPDKINKLPMVIITAAEHQEQLDHVIDKLITLLSLVYKIQIILNS